MPAGVLLALALATRAGDVPRGQIVPSVVTAADPSESYALYVPSAYTPDRAWPLILAFDPGGRGVNPVDRYRAAAEAYGFIVAGSNNSRNGSPDTSHAVSSMWNDVVSRVHVDPARVYTAGMSGGSRVAVAVALASPAIAGVVASSAGYPDAVPRKTLRFPIFATAGTDDFNHLEMRQLDAALTTPHHLAIFPGGHVWLSSDLAMEAVEWLEIQAMTSGIEPRRDDEIDRILAKRLQAADAARSPADRFLAFQSIASDFAGLRDVSAARARADALGKDGAVRATLKRDRDDDDRELRTLMDVRDTEARLASADDRPLALADLRQTWKTLSTEAHRPDDTPERRFARRVLGGLSMSVTTADKDYLAIIREYRWNALRTEN